MATFKTSLIAAKTRVAPVKTLTIPRLELCAAVLGTRLLDVCRTAIDKLGIHVRDVVGWTDSTVVLAWLADYPSTWTCFVANRVAEIQGTIPPSNWKHVATCDNPADPASRGLTASQLVKHTLWWNGPEWLQTTADNWPAQPALSAPVTERKATAKRSVELVLATTTKLQQKPVVDETRFSTYNKLVRSFAYVLRFRNAKTLLSLKGKQIDKSELVTTQCKLLALHQARYFASDLNRLKGGMYAKSANLISLALFFEEEDGLIRVGGRLSQSDYDVERKHPILVDGHSHLGELLIRQAHLETHHGGPQATLYRLRQRFWLTGGRKVVRSFTRACPVCRAFAKADPTPQMGDLPTERITPTRPFTNTGVDFGGPLMIKKGGPKSKTTEKAYIALFVCFTTKAVHIELVSSLTTAACIAALKRFASRRGLPSCIYSDNGSNFLGARNELQALHAILSKDEKDSLSEFATNRGVQWVTIPPRAPHFGGLWEAGIKSCKTHLRKVVGNQVLTFEELTTVLTQIEAALNSRPLTPMSSDPNDHEVLSPGHFLIGAPLDALPSSQGPKKHDPSPRDRWKLTQAMFQSFWDRWSKEYLANLQQRSKWTKDIEESIKVGDLVLLRDERTKPLQWPRARVTKLFLGNDDIARVAEVKTVDSTFTRPIVKLKKLLSAPEHETVELPGIVQGGRDNDC